MKSIIEPLGIQLSLKPREIINQVVYALKSIEGMGYDSNILSLPLKSFETSLKAPEKYSDSCLLSLAETFTSHLHEMELDDKDELVGIHNGYRLAVIPKFDLSGSFSFSVVVSYPSDNVSHTLITAIYYDEITFWVAVKALLLAINEGLFRD